MLCQRHARHPYESALTIKLFKWDHPNERRAGRNNHMVLAANQSITPLNKQLNNRLEAPAHAPVCAPPSAGQCETKGGALGQIDQPPCWAQSLNARLAAKLSKKGSRKAS